MSRPLLAQLATGAVHLVLEGVCDVTRELLLARRSGQSPAGLRVKIHRDMGDAFVSDCEWLDSPNLGELVLTRCPPRALLRQHLWIELHSVNNSGLCATLSDLELAPSSIHCDGGWGTVLLRSSAELLEVSILGSALKWERASDDNPGRYRVHFPAHARLYPKCRASTPPCMGERFRVTVRSAEHSELCEVAYSTQEARLAAPESPRRQQSVRHHRKTRRRECNFEKIRRRFYFGHVFVLDGEREPRRRYRIHHELGHGRSKVTFAVMCLDDHETCAAKVVSRNDRGDLEAEVAVHMDVQRHCTKSADDAYDDLPAFLPEILELGEVDGGDFVVLIVESGIPLPHGLSDKRLTFLAWAMAVAVHQLNRAGYVHCDIKPSNFVVLDGIWPVMCDLGSATRFGGPAGRKPGPDDRVPLREYTRGYLDPSIDLSLRPPDTTIRYDMYSWAQTVRRLASSLSGDVEVMVQQCEAPDASDRPASFREVAEYISPDDECIQWGRTFRACARRCISEVK
jgi:hypothetical protein